MLAWILNNAWLLALLLAFVALAWSLFTYLRKYLSKFLSKFSLKLLDVGRSKGNAPETLAPEVRERPASWYEALQAELGRLEKLQEKPEWYETLQEELDRLPVGKVVFNPADTMRLGVKERVEARISRDVNANLVASLRGRGLPQTEELKISELMKVRLSGDDFEVIALNTEEQIIEATGFTAWAWDVTPRRSGNNILHLHVTLRIRLPFGEEKKDHPVLDREITVQVNPVYSVQSFIATYWKWLVTALVLPLIGWVWKTYINVE